MPGLLILANDIKGMIRTTWKRIQRLPWLTFLLIAVMCVIEYLATQYEYRHAWNEAYGYRPEKRVTYITHAFLHSDNWHLTVNMGMLFVFGWPSEKQWGIPWTAALIGFSALCSGWAAGQLAGTDKWPTDINPVGFNHAANTLLVTGTYGAVMALSNCLSRKFPDLLNKEGMKQTIRVFGRFLAIWVCWWSVSGQATWNPENQTGQVAHAVGALIGGATVLLYALTNIERSAKKQEPPISRRP